MMTSYVWHCFCTYCTKIQVFITFQHYHVTQCLSGTTVLEARPKVQCIRPRPKLRDQDQDRGRSETSLVIGLRPQD